MKLDTTYMRYLTPDDWKVLQAVEQGSHNHEVVPTRLIAQLASLKQGLGSTNRAISDLAKINLISRLRNAKYDGYRITYNGFDYVALKTLHQHDNLEELESTIGVGKESDIYSAKTKNGEQRVLKIHRLGRVSFRTVRNKRDYLKIGQGGSWMYLSKLAAQKEYEFMSILYSNRFEVPIPYDCSRHCVLMERIVGFPMRQLREHYDYKRLYSQLMEFALKLANNGLIHCDYNEYNIMIKEDGTYVPGKEVGFVVIDFPQCISIEHPDAEFYFKRDINCIRKFFKKRFAYFPKSDPMMLDVDGFGEGFKNAYPIFRRDVKRVGDLDVQVKASGFKRKLNSSDRELQNAVSSMKGDAYEGDDEAYDSQKEEEDSFSSQEEKENDDDDGEEDDYDFDEYNQENITSEDEREENLDEENEKIIEALTTGVGNLKMDKLGNYILSEEGGGK